MSQRIVVFLYALIFPLSSGAAPIPGTSSSQVTLNNLTLFKSELGFQIDSQNTDWRPADLPSGARSIVALYKDPQVHNGVQASLSVRVDQLERPMKLPGYVKHWMKDYRRLGFEVLGSKPVRLNGLQGYLIDVSSQETKKQLRQIVFLKNQTAVVMTCRDHRDRFHKTVDSCNRIIGQFRWND